MRTFSPILFGVLGGALLSAIIGVGAARAVPNTSNILPLDEVKAGMKGYGLTVFQGTSPEKFDVEIIGVLKGFRPNQDLILIKTPNHPRLDAAKTVAGMSGSPIYLDGKMIGAYAYGWTFGSEPIAGVTPIQNMLDDLAKPIPPLFKPRANLFGPKKDASSSKDASPKEAATIVPQSPRAYTAMFSGGASENAAFSYSFEDHAKQLATRAKREMGAGSTLEPASTPIMFGGLTPSSMALLESTLTPMGLIPVQAGGAGTKVDPDAPTSFVDGGAIAVQLVRGDISAMGLGTVTRVEGDKLVAFGHPMMGGGASDLPTAVGKVHWILASSNRSFKIGEAVRPIGTLVNDRQSSIVIDTKRVASVFPVKVKIEGVDGITKTEWNSECSHDPFLAPMLAAMAIGNPLESTTGERGDMTWHSDTVVKVAGYGSLNLRDFGVTAGEPISSDAFIRSRVVRALGALLNNPWEDVRIESVETTVRISFGRQVAMIRGTEVINPEIDPGESVQIKILLVPYQGKQETRVIEVPIPKDYAGEDVDIDLSPGYELEKPRAAPENLVDLMAALNNPSFPEESIVATIRLQTEGGAAFRGNVAERLPPGALDTIKVSASSVGPETFGSVQQTSHPMKMFIVGRDRVRVHVRANIK
ncbi:MAG: SpoIVB peptidase S55 domain-containing protein [Polyangiaceae bacterium]